MEQWLGTAPQHLVCCLVRMCDEETLNKVFMEIPEGRRKAERPKLRWLDCIQKWSQSMGVKRCVIVVGWPCVLL